MGERFWNKNRPYSRPCRRPNDILICRHGLHLAELDHDRLHVSDDRRVAGARNQTGLTWPGKTPPTYHEIRSLAERLYRAQGVDTQALLGHRHPRMTKVNADPRQAEWLKIR